MSALDIIAAFVSGLVGSFLGSYVASWYAVKRWERRRG